MRAEEVHVAGTRSFAAEVVDFARDCGLQVVGLVCPSGERAGQTVHDLPVRAIEDRPCDGAQVVVGTGDRSRREIVGRLTQAGWRTTTLVHPRAHLAPSVALGEGVLVGPGVVVGARSNLGDHAVVGRGALIGHHTGIGAFATLGPGCNVAGNVRVEPDVFLGMGAVVRDHVSVGRAAVVGMGAVVLRDVASGTTVLGFPAQAAPS